MTDEEVKILTTIERLVCDFDKNIPEIISLLKGTKINKSLGMQLIYSDVCCSTSRNNRMRLFVIMLNESSNLQDDWETAYFLLKEAYIMTDNIYAQLQKLPYPFDLSDYFLEMKQHVNTDELMHPEELEYLNGLQFPLTAYRGMCNKEYEDGKFGVSWTDRKEIAEKYVYYFKNNNDEHEGGTFSIQVSRSDIFAAWGVVGEDKELIIPGIKRL